MTVWIRRAEDCGDLHIFEGYEKPIYVGRITIPVAKLIFIEVPIQKYYENEYYKVIRRSSIKPSFL